MNRTRTAIKSLRSPEHRALRAVLAQARENADLTQTELSKRLAKPQSYVAKYEGGERRLDVIEFFKIVEAIGADPMAVLRAWRRQIR